MWQYSALSNSRICVQLYLNLFLLALQDMETLVKQEKLRMIKEAEETNKETK